VVVASRRVYLSAHVVNNMQAREADTVNLVTEL